MTRHITLYGIPNCDTVKKSRSWLQEHGTEFVFHDFKKQGLDQLTIKTWLQHLSLDVLINKKGTTWRALSDEQKASATNTEQAMALMLANPSIIKRPVLQITENNALKHVSVGFSAAQFESILSQ
ncbi:ArsC family reductase [Undibacterium sp. SXout7W]|uniref:ArsC family reductase n=1 Tax=Undibacterium sp. SXout7W TaxID=3413049 RepID=UPI003BF0F736